MDVSRVGAYIPVYSDSDIVEPSKIERQMSVYMYIDEQDREDMRSVEDEEVNEVLQEALEHDPTIMVSQSERTLYKESWIFGRTKEVVTFSVWHESTGTDGKAYQARLQMSGTGTKEVAIAYLHGIINGAMTAKRGLKNEEGN